MSTPAPATVRTRFITHPRFGSPANSTESGGFASPPRGGFALSLGVRPDAVVFGRVKCREPGGGHRGGISYGRAKKMSDLTLDRSLSPAGPMCRVLPSHEGVTWPL